MAMREESIWKYFLPDFIETGWNAYGKAIQSAKVNWNVSKVSFDLHPTLQQVIGREKLPEKLTMVRKKSKALKYETGRVAANRAFTKMTENIRRKQAVSVHETPIVKPRYSVKLRKLWKRIVPKVPKGKRIKEKGIHQHGPSAEEGILEQALEKLGEYIAQQERLEDQQPSPVEQSSITQHPPLPPSEPIAPKPEEEKRLEAQQPSPVLKKQSPQPPSPPPPIALSQPPFQTCVLDACRHMETVLTQ